MHARTASIPLVVVLLLGIVLVTGAAGAACAAIHACPAADGGTVFQDRPCAHGVPAAAATDSRRARPPAGLHASWFARPDEASARASCDDEGCRCGALERPFDAGLPLAVADALYLDGTWHRYETSVAAWRRNAPDGADRETLRRATAEAACDVMISQRILRTHAEPVLSSLRRRAREAEERGFDDPLLCDTGDPQACEYLDAMTLYRRMVADLVALRTPREGGRAADTDVRAGRS